MRHELKIWPAYFQPVLVGAKTFEVRKNDRNFRRGDEVLLREVLSKSGTYTGRTMLARITYLMDETRFGLLDGYCVFSFEKILDVSESPHLFVRRALKTEQLSVISDGPGLNPQVR